MARTPTKALQRQQARDAALEHLPPAVRAFTPEQQAAWKVRASGGRWKDAAAAAGVPVSTVWHWARRMPAFKAALEAAYMPLDDAHRDVLEQALEQGLDPEAQDKALDRALKAAVHVSRGLGIAASQTTPAHATVAVTVNVGLPDVLGRALPVESAPLDVDAWQADASLVPVSATQSSRARSSSQRAGDAASVQAPELEDGAE